MKKLLTLVLCVLLAACGLDDTNTQYSRSEIGQPGSASLGRIISMNTVNIEGTNEMGGLAGAVAGGAAGSMLGGNTAINIIGATAGAVAGAVIGSAAEKEITKGTAIEFLIQLSSGQVISVVQTNELNLRVGDEVVVVNIGGKSRIRQKIEPVTPAGTATVPQSF